MNPVMIIAEVGSNFDGSLDKAKDYVKFAKGSGADAVKFQTFQKKSLIAPKIFDANSWKDNPRFKNFNGNELPDDWHFILKEVADKKGIEFFSTPFYIEAVDLLERVGVSTYKIASGDITFTPLLKTVGNTKKHVILSTGASSIADIENALNTLSISGASKITLLHCVSNYPPEWREMNLKAIDTLQEKFKLPVGISDHTPGDLVPLASVALGATVIEKHITFDRELNGPDHPFSMTIAEFQDMVEKIRLLEIALGDGVKVPSKKELLRKSSIRRGVYDPDTHEPINDLSGMWLRPEHKIDDT